MRFASTGLYLKVIENEWFNLKLRAACGVRTVTHVSLRYSLCVECAALLNRAKSPPQKAPA